MTPAVLVELRPCHTCGLLRQLVSVATRRNRVPRASYSHTYVMRKKTHYETLGVSQDASAKDIREAFVKLSKQVHPDTNLNDPSKTEQFQQLHTAYSTLSKKSSKREYDFSLATAVRYQQEMMRHGYSSHTPGGSPQPGMGSTPGNKESEERVFWDETIWHMRDKSRDKMYTDKPFYGVHGVNHISNTTILLGCMGLLIIGMVLHYAAFKYSSVRSMEILDKRDRVNAAHLMASRANARKYGNAGQIENLRQKIGSNGRSSSAGDQ